MVTLPTPISIPIGLALLVGLAIPIVLAITIRPIVSIRWLITPLSWPSPPALLTAGLVAVSRTLRCVNSGHVRNINVFIKVLKGFRRWWLRSIILLVAIVSGVDDSHSLVLRLWLRPLWLYEVRQFGLSLRPSPPPETYRK